MPVLFIVTYEMAIEGEKSSELERSICHGLVQNLQLFFSGLETLHFHDGQWFSNRFLSHREFLTYFFVLLFLFDFFFFVQEPPSRVHACQEVPRSIWLHTWIHPESPCYILGLVALTQPAPFQSILVRWASRFLPELTQDLDPWMTFCACSKLPFPCWQCLSLNVMPITLMEKPQSQRNSPKWAIYVFYLTYYASNLFNLTGFCPIIKP